jgi:hypothetical protein
MNEQTKMQGGEDSLKQPGIDEMAGRFCLADDDRRRKDWNSIFCGSSDEQLPCFGASDNLVEIVAARNQQHYSYNFPSFPLFTVIANRHGFGYGNSITLVLFLSKQPRFASIF